MIYKRTINAAPEYLNKLLNLNSQQHSRNTRSADLSLVTPKYNRSAEAGRTFSITAKGIWNKLPLSFRSASSINCFKCLLYQIASVNTRVNLNNLLLFLISNLSNI